MQSAGDEHYEYQPSLLHLPSTGDEDQWLLPSMPDTTHEDPCPASGSPPDEPPHSGQIEIAVQQEGLLKCELEHCMWRVLSLGYRLLQYDPCEDHISLSSPFVSINCTMTSVLPCIF